MATEEVVTKFVADTSDYSAKFQEIENRLKAVEGAAVNAGKGLGKGLGEGSGILEKLKSDLKSYEDARNKAFDVKGISEYNKKIEETQAKISNLTGETKKQTSALGQQFENLGKQLIAAFAVERVIAFGKSAFLAFAQAEQNAKKLQVAVGVNGGLQKDFEKLIKQSKELQDVTIFFDVSFGVNTAREKG